MIAQLTFDKGLKYSGGRTAFSTTSARTTLQKKEKNPSSLYKN